MGTADALIAVIQKWHDDDVHEVPAHSNRTIVGQLFNWNGVSWCCETCSVAAKQTGTPCFWTAAVAQAIADAKAGRYGLTWVPRGDVIRRGDFSTFDWHGRGNPEDFHISTVVDPGTQAKFHTLGGNENDAVTDQWRDRTFVQGFIRPAYSGGPTPAPVPEEDDMRVLFTHKGGEFIGVFGDWCRPIPAGHQGVWDYYKRAGVKVNNTDGTAEVQDDVFNQMTLRPGTG